MTRSVTPYKGGYVVTTPGTSDMDKLLGTFKFLLDTVVIAVSPSSTNVVAGETQAFTAMALDLTGIPLVVQPTFTWTVSGTSGTPSIDANGNYTAGSSAGSDIVMGSALGSNGTSRITVVAPPTQIYTGGSYTPNLSHWTASFSGSGSLVLSGNDVLCWHPDDLLTLDVSSDTGLDGTFDLTGCTALQSLNLANTAITTPPVVTGLTSLLNLELTGAPITTSPTLTGLTSLVGLYSSCSSLTSLPVGLAGCLAISTIYLDGTSIDNYDQLFIDIVETGAINGMVDVDTKYTSASNDARATLASRGWAGFGWDGTAL
jgi:hypothetical protein